MRESARLAGAFLRRDLLEAWTYKGNVASRLVAGLAFLYMAHFTARAFAGHSPPELAAYGGYFPFLFMGLLVTDAGWALLTGPSARLRQAQVTGTLELVVGRLGAARLIALEALGAASAAAVRCVLYVVGAIVLLDADFSVADPGVAALAIALTVAALLPVGLLGGALTLLLKRSDPLGRAVHGLSMLAGGVVYPTSVLPGWLQVAGEALPPTHALRALRGTLLGGADVSGSLMALGALAVAGGTLCAIVLPLADRLARRAGTLGHY